jgi:hypothetical protein
MDGKMQPPVTSGTGGRKRGNLTLDLHSASPKKTRIQSILTSPDVQKLNMSSPDIEKLLSQNPSLATPTPSGYAFPNKVTEEQLMYVKGFEDALQKIQREESVAGNSDTVTAANTLVTLSGGHSLQGPPGSDVSGQVTSVQHHQPPPGVASLPQLPLSLPNTIPNNLPLPRPNSGASGSYDSDSYQVPEGSVKIKDEPDDGSLSGEEESMMSPGQSGMSPINMESQERIKLERKRLRNRQAAAKCRKRKLERISLLDDRVAQLKTENSDLAAVVKKMKASVASLKQEIMEHERSGCEILKLSEAGAFS